MPAKFPYLGYNLYAIRKSRGYSREYVLARLAEMSVTPHPDAPYSLRTLQSWERGEYAVPDEVKIALCDILSCRIEALFFYHLRNTARYTQHIRARVEIADALQQFPARIVSGLWYILTKWSGNPLPLLEMMLCYCRCADKKKRAEMSATLMLCYREAKANHQLLPDAPEPDENYIWEQIDRLNHTDSRKIPRPHGA